MKAQALSMRENADFCSSFPCVSFSSAPDASPADAMQDGPPAGSAPPAAASVDAATGTVPASAASGLGYTILPSDPREARDPRIKIIAQSTTSQPATQQQPILQPPSPTNHSSASVAMEVAASSSDVPQ